jgi:hypothetical protein
MSEAVERLVVSFFGHPCLTVRASDGSIYVSLGDLCDLIGLRTAAQARRLRNDPDLADGLVRFRAATAGGVQDQDFLLLEHVPIWIGSVNRNKAAPDVQEQIGYLRRRIVREVYAAFAREAGLPEGSSRQIEDLQDLDRFDDALGRLADQQRSLEQSMRQDHDQSQRELRQLAARVKALEERIGGTITREQRGYIYQMVHHWAAARVQQEQRTYNEAISSCWAALKARYKLAKYEQLPATLYDDCVQYIEGQYQRLTGSPLNLPEQRGLELEE